MITIWLYFIFDVLNPRKFSTPNIHYQIPKPLKKEKSIKINNKFKLENNVRIELTITKQSRTLFSKILASKQFYIYTREQIKVIKELDNYFKKRDNKFLIVEDIFEGAIDYRVEDFTKI